MYKDSFVLINKLLFPIHTTKAAVYFIKNNVPCLKGKLQAYRFIGFYCFACVFQ